MQISDKLYKNSMELWLTLADQELSIDKLVGGGSGFGQSSSLGQNGFRKMDDHF